MALSSPIWFAPDVAIPVIVQAVVQRCQVHKKRNVEEHLPKHLRDEVRARMHAAYSSTNADQAASQLLFLANDLEEKHPSAAASIREGLDETLTAKRLGLPSNLERALTTTNIIENLMGSIRYTTHHVKTWRSGSMVLRWCALALLEASANFKPMPARTQIPKLIQALATLARTNQQLERLALAA